MKKTQLVLISIFSSLILIISIFFYVLNENFNKRNTLKFEEYSSEINVAREINRLTRLDGAGNYVEPVNLYKEYSNSLKKSIQSRTEELDWKNRGPGNVGGRMRTIVVDKQDITNQTWFAGSAGGGIWKTVNSGTSWTSVTDNLDFLSFVTLAQSQSNPNILYAGTGEGALGGSFSNGVGIFKSIDGGETWTFLEATSYNFSNNFQNTNRIIISPSNSDIVYAATSNGVNGQEFNSALMKTIDGGITWSKVYQPNSRVQQIVAHPENFNILFISTILNGIQISNDGGVTFEDSNLKDVVQSSGGDIERTEFVIGNSNPDIMYASVSYLNRSGSGLFMSQDGGFTWINITNEDNLDKDFLEQGEYDNCIAVNPFDDLEVFWGGVNLYKAKINLSDVVSTGRGFKGAIEDNTTDFLSFVTFDNGTHYGNRLAVKDETNTPSIEIRFGAGLSQKAHRFLVPAGSTSGVPDENYSYVDYIDVPFEVWDVEDNRQLMISFRDQENNGVFNLNERNPDDELLADNREYLYIHDITYADNPENTIAVSGGQEVSQLIFFWPTLSEGGGWDPDNLPTSSFNINFGDRAYLNATIDPLSTNVHPDHHALTTINLSGNTFRLVSVNDGGVAYTDNKGLSFVTVESGLNTSQFYSATKKIGEDVYFGGTQDNGLLLSQIGPSSLSEYSENNAGVFADGFEVIWSRNSPEMIMASNQRNSIFRTIDGGQSWRYVRSGLDDSGFDNEDAPFFTKLANNPVNNIVYAISNNGIWRSNFGENWSLYDLSGNTQWGGFLDIEVSSVNSKVIWAGGAMSESRGIFLSNDGGISFELVGKYENSIGNITSIVPDPNNVEGAYLLFSQTGSPKILKTIDKGQTWIDITGFDEGSNLSTKGFPNVATCSLLIFPDGLRMWAGTELGIVETLNGGEEWSLLNSSLPNVLIWDMKVIDGQIVVATHGRGIWTVDLGITYQNEQVISGFQNEINLGVSLYPNPASNYITVNLNSQNLINRTVITDVNGKTIKTVELADKIDISDLKIGLYYLRLENRNGEFQNVKFIKN